MTEVPVDDPETLRRILANTEALLLDFDGPICSVFSGFPAHVVADQLRDILAEGGYRDLPDEVAKSEDPFDVLKYAATLGDDEARYVEAAFRAHEVEAISTSTPTPGAHDLIRNWKSTHRPLAIVSNNSAASIKIYLDLHSLHDDVDYVSGRTHPDVTLLKPNPYLVNQAMNKLDTRSERCIFIGDSDTDIKAGQALRIHTIGFANKPGKINKFTSADADAGAIITSIKIIVKTLTEK